MRLGEHLAKGHKLAFLPELPEICLLEFPCTEKASEYGVSRVLAVCQSCRLSVTNVVKGRPLTVARCNASALHH